MKEKGTEYWYYGSNAVLTSPPFEVHETGWGEFEIQIKIFFTDTTEKPVSAFTYKQSTQRITSAGYPLPFTKTVPG